MKFETLGLMIMTRSCFDEKFGGKLQVNPLVLRIRSDFKKMLQGTLDNRYKTRWASLQRLCEKNSNGHRSVGHINDGKVVDVGLTTRMRASHYALYMRVAM